MKRTYTREFRKLVEAEIQSGASSTSLCKKYSLPYGTVARWKWTLKLNAEPSKTTPLKLKDIKRAHKEVHKEERPTDQDVRETFDRAIEILRKSVIRESQTQMDMRRQNLISYILGIFVGMAIGSMIVNYLAR